MKLKTSSDQGNLHVLGWDRTKVYVTYCNGPGSLIILYYQLFCITFPWNNLKQKCLPNNCEHYWPDHSPLLLDTITHCNTWSYCNNCVSFVMLFVLVLCARAGVFAYFAGAGVSSTPVKLIWKSWQDIGITARTSGRHLHGWHSHICLVLPRQ